MKDSDPNDSIFAGSYATALNTIAARTIRHGLDRGAPGPLSDVPPALMAPRATFVTLELGGALRGCVGGLEARQALASDVNAHAFAAAFHDPRFEPVREQEWTGLVATIAILSPRAPFPAAGEAEAIAALRPGVDGVVLSDGHHRGVFLPKVWDEVPDPGLFLKLLKRKAGLPDTFWSAGIRLERFTVEAVPPANLAALL